MKLYSPLTIGDLTLPNRVALAPMTRARSPGNKPNETNAEYYVQRSGAGLILSEGTFTSEQAIGWVDAPGIYTDEQVEGWKEITSGVHAAGGIMFCQLWHTGRASDSSFRPNAKDGRGVAPSPIALKGEVHAPRGKVPAEVPRELTTEEVEALPEEYRKAAANAKAAGFDGVELHCANGYLLNTFLDSKTNQRTDNYGGSNENRFRIVADVLEAIFTVFDPSSVSVRLSPNGIFNDMGCPDYREIYTYYAKRLDEMKIGYLHVMTGLGFGFHELGEPMIPADFKAVFKSGALIVNVGYTKDTAEKVVEDGHADIVAIGRPYISNPDLVERFKTGAELNPDADVSVWYSGGFGGKGYTDFPKMS